MADAKKPNRKLFRDLLRALRRIKQVGNSDRLAAVLRTWTDSSTAAFPEKLAIPLKGNYPMKGENPKQRLSFAGLSTSDRLVAEALRRCRDARNHQLLDVFLCIVTLYRSGRTAPSYGERSYSPPPSWVPESCYDPPSEDEDEIDDYGHEIGELDEERIEGTAFRVGWDDERVKDGWRVATDEIVVGEGGKWVSGFDIDNPSYSKYDSDDKYLEQWYHRAMLVLWPCEVEEEDGEEEEEEENNDNLNSGGSVEDPDPDGSCEPEKKRRKC